MENKVKSIRTFIGAKNYQISRDFYRDIGFQEVVLSADMSYFNMEGLGFYLQNAYVKDWVNNSMIFMEVVDLQKFWAHLVALNLDEKYENVILLPIRELDWGKECFLHDPSGILWHFGTFNNQ
jgi:catechol 2,3-dioxygenase-like lactoylglutathione lyase family enzyme